MRQRVLGECAPYLRLNWNMASADIRVSLTEKPTLPC
jgi:hypothetical protein